MTDFLERLPSNPPRWNSGSGPEASIVNSTRVRLARNLAGHPFPHRADPAALCHVRDSAARLATEAPMLRGVEVLDLETTPILERELLVERHLISREFAQTGRPRALLADPAETVAIMVNEEDHFRFQVLRSGLDAIEGWRIIHAIEREADARLEFAFDEKWGYLSACPTNLGTGLRVSALCHLPALSIAGEIKDLVEAAGQVGIAVRGFYGEGSTPSGNFLQFSNRSTLGRNELEIVHEIENWVRQVVERESRCREAMIAKQQIALLDKIHRARGILASARLVTAQETMALLSLVRLGVDLGLIESPSVATLNLIQVATQPAHLQRRAGRMLSPAERDEARATYIREAL